MKTYWLLLICYICSTHALKRRGRILGGSLAQPGQHPYVVSIRNQGKHQCVGTIFSDNVVLTAASCIPYSNPEEMTILAGTLKQIEGGTCYPIKKVLIQNECRPVNMDNNIALIFINGTIEFGPTVQQCNLSKAEFGPYTKVTVVGWGNTSDLTEDLQTLDINTVPTDICAKAWPNDDINDNNTICTQPLAKSGNCPGDAGGPMLDTNDLLVGISTGYTKCNADTESSHTKIAYFKDWIKEHTSGGMSLTMPLILNAILSFSLVWSSLTFI